VTLATPPFPKKNFNRSCLDCPWEPVVELQKNKCGPHAEGVRVETPKGVGCEECHPPHMGRHGSVEGQPSPSPETFSNLGVKIAI